MLTRVKSLSQLIPLLAFWPVFTWYIARILDGSDEPWGVVALLTALIFIFLQNHSCKSIKSNSLCSIILVVYILTYFFAPPLFRATLFIFWLAAFISQKKLGASIHLGILGLLLLSLPIIASLQFFLGYPIRIVTTQIASKILGMIGYTVVPKGTLMAWAGELIAVDAPCAGIRMLWCALFISFTLSCFLNLSTLATWLSYSLTALVVFLANIFRTVILFFIELKIIKLPFPAHVLTGLIIFFCVIASVFFIANFLKAFNSPLRNLRVRST